MKAYIVMQDARYVEHKVYYLREGKLLTGA